MNLTPKCHEIDKLMTCLDTATKYDYYLPVGVCPVSKCYLHNITLNTFCPIESAAILADTFMNCMLAYGHACWRVGMHVGVLGACIRVCLYHCYASDLSSDVAMATACSLVSLPA